tara:strand:+ start:10648 stop:11172 length:525 start_codon:yes stop_codon:yes gene_type:complete
MSEEKKAMVAEYMLEDVRTVGPGVAATKGWTCVEGSKAFERIVKAKAFTTQPEAATKKHPFLIHNATDELVSAELKFRGDLEDHLKAAREKTEAELAKLEAQVASLKKQGDHISKVTAEREEQRKRLREKLEEEAKEARAKKEEAELRAEVEKESEIKALLKEDNTKPSGRKKS